MTIDYIDSIPMKTHSSSEAIPVWAHRLKAGCEPLCVPGLPNSLVPSPPKPCKFSWKADIFQQLVPYEKKKPTTPKPNKQQQQKQTTPFKQTKQQQKRSKYIYNKENLATLLLSGSC